MLSKEEGLSKDYGHVDMIVSKEAAEEVWPSIAEWFNNITPAAINTGNLR